MPGAKAHKENQETMKSKPGPEELMSEQWHKLKKRAEHERNPEKLIAILEEIDDLLFNLEMRIAARSGRALSWDETDSRSAQNQSTVLSDDSEIGSQ
jgi:hypothetical protein